MKTKGLLILSIFILGGLSLSSCKKEDPIRKTETSIHYNKPLEDKVLGFIDHYKLYKQGMLLKDNEEISVDNAISFLDESFNYTYSFQVSKYLQQKWDSNYIEIPLTKNGTVLVNSGLYEIYDSIIGKVRNGYRNVTGDNKRLIGLVIQKLGVNALTNKLQIRLISQVTSGYPTSGSTEDNFWLKDSWTCDYSFIGPGQGAPTILENDMNFIFNPAPPPGYRIGISGATVITWDMYTDLVTYRNPNDPNPPDNFEDYYFYYANSSVSNWNYPLIGCIEGFTQPNTEMSYYEDQLHAYISNYAYNHSPLSCYNCIIECRDITTTVFPYTRTLYHLPHVSFGVKHLYALSNYPVPID